MTSTNISMYKLHRLAQLHSYICRMDCYTSVVVVLTLLGMQELVDADCYPGDKQYTDITEEIYKNVIGDTINGLRGYGPLTRFQLCSLLVTNHNSGKLHGTGQINTNHDFLGQPISLSSCVNALVNLKGYQTDEGWKKWAGSHVGTWWFTSKSLSDNARWDQPQLKDNSRTYFVQKIEFFSQWRKDNSKHVNQAGTTCKFGWHQSGSGVSLSACDMLYCSIHVEEIQA